jgi:ABC-2 type transport system permease protein
MGKLIVVFKREYLERVRSKWFVVVTLLGPVFFAAITALPLILATKTRTSSDLTNVAVIDATGSDLGERVVLSIKRQAPEPGAREPILRIVPPDSAAAAESLATAQVVRRELKGYLVLDSATLAGQSFEYAGRNASSMVDVRVMTDAVRQSILNRRFEREGISPDRVMTLTALKLDTRTEKITDSGREGTGGMASFFFGYGIALLLYMMIAIYGQNVLRGVMEEKTTRVAEVVVSSVKTDTLLAGKVLGVGSVALTQVVAWLVMMYGLYKVRGPLLASFGVQEAMATAIQIPNVSWGVGIALVLFFGLGFIFYAALFAAVGAMVNNQEDAQQAAMPVMLLLLSAIVFMQPTLLNPSSEMAVISSWLPFSAPILMPLRMSLTSVSWLELAAVLGGVAVACAAAIWLSARIYRVGLLMYGKRPSIGELVKWIRMA